MKTSTLSSICFVWLLAMVASGCSKDESEEAPTIPVVITTPVTSLTPVSAISGGTVTSGNIGMRKTGICWGTDPNPTLEDNYSMNPYNGQSFKSQANNLNTNTTYYLRAYATNPAGTGYGNEVSFTTPEYSTPEVVTSPISLISHDTAVGGGRILSDGYSVITERGVCWSTGTNPNLDDLPSIEPSEDDEILYPAKFSKKAVSVSNSNYFTSNVIQLTSNTTYYIRAYATNSSGTGYGETISFTTQPGSTEIVYDIDGNAYHTISIGKQVWMVENLKVTHYRNGDPIPNVSDNTSWDNLTTGAYCNFQNDAAIADTYGRLYNWFAATDTRNIAPTGWHVPSYEEWRILSRYLNPCNEDKLKETGDAHWGIANGTATNESGFTALGSGARINKNFVYLRTKAIWWTSTIQEYFSGRNYAVLGAWFLENLDIDNKDGCSIRCVKD